jgi:hypothetical protein
MRHTHATLLLEDGATERYVAERLGDTVEMIHETYGHVTPQDADRGRRAPGQALSRPAMTETAAVRDRSVTEHGSTAGGKGPAT